MINGEIHCFLRMFSCVSNNGVCLIPAHISKYHAVLRGRGRVDGEGE